MASFYRKDGSVFNAIGQAIAGAKVYVCTQPNSINLTTPTIPPSPLATIYSDGTGTALANPVTVDGNGNFNFYAAIGLYTLVYFDPFNRIPSQAFPDQLVVGPGGGQVNSVGLTAPGEFTVTGSPVTGTGTLALSKNSQNANSFYRGPTSGGSAAPIFGPLVAADLPAGVLPVSGLSNVSFSATPTFNAGAATSFAMTLTGNVTLATISNPTNGEQITFLITQDATGGRLFNWPANVQGAGTVAPDPNSTSVQSFLWTGSVWKATGSMISF